MSRVSNFHQPPGDHRFAVATDDEPIDFWRAVVRRGVLAVGFGLFGHDEQKGMTAELVAPQDGWTRRAAHAAIEMHKLVGMEPGTSAHAARQALGAELGQGSAVRALAAYQAALTERLWAEIQDAPVQRLEGLAYPHEDDDLD